MTCGIQNGAPKVAINATTAVIGRLVRSVAIPVGLANKHFYWLKGRYSGDKEASRWSGRLLFVFLGALFILIRFGFLILGY